MVEEPVQSFEWNIAMTFSKTFKEPRDAFVVGGMQTKRPFICSKQRHKPPSVRFRAMQPGRDVVPESSKSAAEKTNISPAPLQPKEIVAFSRPGSF